VDITSISNNVLGEESQAIGSDVYLVQCVSVPDGAQQWCISWKSWIPCSLHKEVVADCAVVVNSWLLYCGVWSQTMRWGR